MKRKVVTTADGSTTIHLEAWNEQYHSKHGAIQEAYHVFIKNGLHKVDATDIAILEMGFGTGLNALITYLEVEKSNCRVSYHGIEAFPVRKAELEQLNFISELGIQHLNPVFQNLHSSPWEETVKIADFFSLYKQQSDFLRWSGEQLFNLIYFDAFGPRVQPELWTKTIFEKTFKALQRDGILVTYSAKGSVRRAMQEIGFVVERLPGPPGKREMLRAVKP
ncbi:MAG: tRNA (5-methylaminomethyl-2-thiouridine)(34)-methyltransferase MnmD [Bacteroidota bacterium]